MLISTANLLDLTQFSPSTSLHNFAKPADINKHNTYPEHTFATCLTAYANSLLYQCSFFFIRS